MATSVEARAIDYQSNGSGTISEQVRKFSSLTKIQSTSSNRGKVIRNKSSDLTTLPG